MTPTQVRIGLPLPMDMTSSIISAIGAMYPDATMGGNGPGYGAELVLNIPESNRRPKATKRALAAAKVTTEDPGNEPELTGFEDGTISMTTPKDAAERLAEWAYILLTSVDATNYVEQAAEVPETGKRLVVIAAWSEQQTPHEMRQRADARADHAEVNLEEVRTRIGRLTEHLEDMADSLDDHVTHDDVHRLLTEALTIARGQEQRPGTPTQESTP